MMDFIHLMDFGDLMEFIGLMDFSNLMDFVKGTVAGLARRAVGLVYTIVCV